MERLDRGVFGLGSVARIKQPAQPASEWTVTEFARGARFAWESRRRGLRMKGIHEVSPDGAGTRSTLRVEAGGVLAMLFWPFLRVVMRRALRDENRGLKERCEAAAGAGRGRGQRYARAT